MASLVQFWRKRRANYDEIYLEIESDRKNTTLPLDKEYNDSYWKWKDAVAVNEIAQTKLKKYETNMNADIPDVMIELKEIKNEMQRQNEELKNEMQCQNKVLKNEVKEVQQQNYELTNELKEVQRQNYELTNEVKEMQRQNYELKKEVKNQIRRQNEELKTQNENSK